MGFVFIQVPYGIQKGISMLNNLISLSLKFLIVLFLFFSTCIHKMAMRPSRHTLSIEDVKEDYYTSLACFKEGWRGGFFLNNETINNYTFYLFICFSHWFVALLEQLYLKGYSRSQCFIFFFLVHILQFLLTKC